MNVEEAANHLRGMLADVGFDPASPSPELVWQVFQKFVSVPVESGGGRQCEEVWFEASDGDPIKGWSGYFDFVRMFNHYTENDACWHEMITAHFAIPAEIQRGIRGSICADLNDLPTFFQKVEGSPLFQNRLAYLGWSFEVRVDCA